MKRITPIILAVALFAAGLCLVRSIIFDASFKAPSDQTISTLLPGNARDVFEHPDKLILYSLQPPEHLVIKGLPSFHDVPVLGKVEVSDEEARASIRRAVYDGFARDADRKMCYMPRHGIRAVKGKQTVDLVLCFQCEQMKIFLNGKGSDYLGFGGKHYEELDAILKADNIHTAS